MNDMFRRSKGSAGGYDPKEVEEFFEQARAIYEGESTEVMGPEDIRTASFAVVRKGYDLDAVDKALERLEIAFVRRERNGFIDSYGKQAWLDQITEQATTLYPRLTRPDGEKFAPAARGDRGYVPRQVDAMCDRLVAYFNEDRPLTSHELRTQVFQTVRGRKGYSTAPVDAFIDRAIEVLVATE